MKRFRLAYLGLVVLLAATAGPAFGQQVAESGITVTDAWARATPPSASTAAIYATIRNEGDAPDRLIGIESAIAGNADIHKMTMQGGVMRMRPLSDGLAVAPGASVALAPGGVHGMLIGLKKPLSPGDNFSLWAIFESGERVETTVSVVPMGAPPPGSRP